MTRLVHIVPRIPPAIDGIGDFAWELGLQLQETLGIESFYVTADLSQASAPDVHVLTEHTAAHCCQRLERIEPDVVLVHYSGYGYHPRGIPSWLVDGLEKFRSRSNASIVIFFHEIWASGPFWKSEFYLAGMQKRLIGRLQALADSTFTSTPRMQRPLSEFGNVATVAPIPSFVASAAGPRKVSRNRGMELVIFGLEHSRRRTLRSHSKLLRALCESGNIGSLSIIGMDASLDEVRRIAGPHAAKITRVVPNPSAESVGRIVSNADALLTFYPANLLTKSSTAMVAFASGCPVILPSGEGEDQFEPRPPFMVCDGSERGIAALVDDWRRGDWLDAGMHSSNWYRKHASWDQMVGRLALALPVADVEIVTEIAV